MNVLIIEDDADICQLYTIWLREYDYHYVIARNVEDGLYEYHKSRQNNPKNFNFDLIILDYDLSSKNNNNPSITKNGLNVAKEVLSLNKNQRIIFASAWPQKIFNEYIETLKCFIEILQKPFEKDIFIKMVQDTFVYDTLKKVVEDMRKNGLNPNKPDSGSYVNLFELLWKLQRDTFGTGNN
ncbi:MAG TPA: response regulator [Candidatus Sulfopaludibacter sp.]|jgi:DNA-binding response OmpR family regulator|nr:response regulator [Candidatus Sulfopaludibacter sp.]